jgi:SAM-dependent methyltransferase
MEILEAHPDVALVAARYFTKLPGGIKQVITAPGRWVDRPIRAAGVDVIDFAKQIWTGTVLLRRSVLGDERFLTALEPAEDRDLWIRLLRGCAGYMLSLPLATAVLVPDSLSRRDPDFAYEPMIRVLHRHADLTTRAQLRRLEAQVYRGWASAHLFRGAARRAIRPSLARLRRQPASAEAWWVFSKALRWSLSGRRHRGSPSHDGRDLKSLREHFEIEKELADRLRQAPADQRRTLYRQVYNELFQRVANHPQNQRKADLFRQRLATRWQWRLLSHFVSPRSAYLEIGAGDGHLAMRVARRARRAYALDVSEVIASGNGTSANFAWLLTDGVRIPLASGSINVAYSNQLMEHLHPDDAAAQLGEIRRTLAPGGRYVCITPHRYSGPHDISKYFSDEPSGFHLKEYTYRELDRLFRDAGFSFTRAWTGLKGRFFMLPLPLVLTMEWLLGRLPRPWQKRLCCGMLLRPIFINVTLVGYTDRRPAPRPARPPAICQAAT